MAKITVVIISVILSFK